MPVVRGRVSDGERARYREREGSDDAGVVWGGLSGVELWRFANVSDGGQLVALWNVASQRDSDHAVGGVRPFLNDIKFALTAPTADRSVV